MKKSQEVVRIQEEMNNGIPPMKSAFLYKALLSGAVLLVTGCSGSEDLISASRQKDSSDQKWKVSINATTSELTTGEEMDDVTRSFFIGGNEDNRYGLLWDKGDVVQVFKDNTLIGTVEPQEAYWGTKNATLTGELTGSLQIGDRVDLYLPSFATDFTGQDGQIVTASHKAYQRRLNVAVASIDGDNLTLEDVNMAQRSAFIRFLLTDADDPEHPRLHPQRLELIPVSGGQGLLKTNENDEITLSGSMVIDVAKTDGEYLGEIFIAWMRQTDKPTYKLKATMPNGDIYMGPIGGTGQLAYSPGLSAGSFNNCRRQLRKTTAVSTLAVADIPSKVFTGSAIVPDNTEIVVKDGETTLTLDADYSVAYTNNVNAGMATATITGLAEQGTTCTTPYLGTQEKTFQITKATPVIVMDASTMTLVNNATQNTQTRTVSSVYLDNSAFGIDNLEILGAPYNCTVNYTSSNESVATVDLLTGQVIAVGPGTCTITATVVEADNWLTNAVAATYTVNVEQEVNGGNSVNPWTSGGEPEGGKIFVE